MENTIELISIESIKRCVAANIGVSYLPRFAVVKELECGELIELPFGEQSQTITAMCAHHAGKAVSPAMHTFIQCVEECFCRDKNNAGLKPGIEITLLSFAVARPFRLVYGAYQYFWCRDGVFHPRLLFLFSFFFSARFASTFFDGLPVCFSLGARVFGRNSSITRALIGSSI